MDSPVHCGIDIIEIDRFKEFLDRSTLSQLETLFTNKELKDIQPDKALSPRQIQQLAGSFCLKEACLKVFPKETCLKIIDFNDIITDHDTFGAPIIVTTDKLKELMIQYQIKGFSASVSHTDHYSCGLVVAF